MASVNNPRVARHALEVLRERKTLQEAKELEKWREWEPTEEVKRKNTGTLPRVYTGELPNYVSSFTKQIENNDSENEPINKFKWPLFISSSSAVSNYTPKVGQCSIRGCVFPAITVYKDINKNVAVCRLHQKFYDMEAGVFDEEILASFCEHTKDRTTRKVDFKTNSGESQWSIDRGLGSLTTTHGKWQKITEEITSKVIRRPLLHARLCNGCLDGKHFSTGNSTGRPISKYPRYCLGCLRNLEKDMFPLQGGKNKKNEAYRASQCKDCKVKRETERICKLRAAGLSIPKSKHKYEKKKTAGHSKGRPKLSYPRKCLGCLLVLEEDMFPFSDGKKIYRASRCIMCKRKRMANRYRKSA